MELQTNQTQITGASKQIEGIEFLKNFQSELIEINYIKFNGSCDKPTEYVEDLTVVISSKYITLYEQDRNDLTIRILKETILDIEEAYSNKIIIHTVNNDIIINKI